MAPAIRTHFSVVVSLPEFELPDLQGASGAVGHLVRKYIPTDLVV